MKDKLRMTSMNVYIGTSLDGFIARGNGDFDWLHTFANDEAVEAYHEFIADIDVIVIGRGTFEKVIEFTDWPYDKPVFVLSRTLKELPSDTSGKADLLSLESGEVKKYLSEQGFKAAYIDGGKVIQSFLDADLVDTLTISRVPVLIGNGIPLFGHLNADLAFEHLETRVASNGLVRSYYKRKRD